MIVYACLIPLIQVQCVISKDIHIFVISLRISLSLSIAIVL